MQEAECPDLGNCNNGELLCDCFAGARRPDPPCGRVRFPVKRIEFSTVNHPEKS